MKKAQALFMVMIVLMAMTFFTGCDTDAQIASQNLSKAAEQFEINRRVVFYNGITDTYILAIEGRCSVDFFDNKFTVTVKTGPNEFKKHYLGRADNVFPFVEQMDDASVSTYHYRVIFKPKAILPNVDLVN